LILLTDALNINLTAEGVETEDQLNKLKLLSCEKAQGYYFSKPMDAESQTLFSIQGRTNRSDSEI